MKLFCSAILKFTAGVLLTGLLLFLPAGTLHWQNGWLFMGLLFIPMFIAGLVMMLVTPGLLRSRLQARESENTQRSVIRLSGSMFVIGFVLAGLDFRYSWSSLPVWVSCVAAALLLIAYALYVEVMRENTYLSRTIQVQEGQQVVDTGLYGIVRHPMYMVTLLMFLSIPLVLGSWWSFLLFLTYPAIIVKRILNEEQVLKAELPGYEAYCNKVHYRLFPGIW